MANTNRPLHEIAKEIIDDFKREYHEENLKYVIGKKITMPRHWRQKYIHALAYVEQMATLLSIDDDYGCDSGRSIVIYALGNLQVWKGEKAKEIKKELKAML
jgi:hypothetical protein